MHHHPNRKKSAHGGRNWGYTDGMNGSQLLRSVSCLTLLVAAHVAMGADSLATGVATAPFDLASALTRPIPDVRPVQPIPGQTVSSDDSLDLGATTATLGLPSAPIPLWPAAGRLSGQAEWLRIYGRQRQLPAPPPTSFFQLVAPNYLQKPNYTFHLSSDWHSWATLGAGFTQLF